MSWICKYCSTNNQDEDKRCIVCDNVRGYSINCTLTQKRVQSLKLTGDVIIPEKFNIIGEGAFRDRTDITSVTLHSGVKKIMGEAFYGCINLRKVTCPQKLNSIGDRAFYGCRYLPESERPKSKLLGINVFGYPYYASYGSTTSSTSSTASRSTSSYVPPRAGTTSGSTSSTSSSSTSPYVAPRAGTTSGSTSSTSSSSSSPYVAPRTGTTASSTGSTSSHETDTPKKSGASTAQRVLTILSRILIFGGVAALVIGVIHSCIGS